MQHSETPAQQAAADDIEVAGAARVYLRHGPARVTEVIRVLTDHFETIGAQRVHESMERLINTGALSMAGANVSLPTGGDQRDTKEQGR